MQVSAVHETAGFLIVWLLSLASQTRVMLLESLWTTAFRWLGRWWVGGWDAIIGIETLRVAVMGAANWAERINGVLACKLVKFTSLNIIKNRVNLPSGNRKTCMLLNNQSSHNWDRQPRTEDAIEDLLGQGNWLNLLSHDRKFLSNGVPHLCYGRESSYSC